jgi:hypothetical protein
VPSVQLGRLAQRPHHVVAVRAAPSLACRGVGARDGVVELGDVEPERRVRPPLNRPRLDVDESIGVGQCVPQVMEHVTQVRPRLRFARVRPESKREVLARLSGVAIQKQIRQKRLGTRGPQRRHGPVAESKIEAAEESDRKRFRCHESPFQRNQVESAATTIRPCIFGCKEPK